MRLNQPSLASPEDPATKFFYDRQELATRWGCSIPTLKRMEARGELVPSRLGRRVIRYGISQIEKIEATALTNPKGHTR